MHSQFQPARTEKAQATYLLHPETLDAHRCVVLASRRGLKFQRVPGTATGRLPAPPLHVPWWAVKGFGADDTATGPDGSALQVVDVVTDAGTLTLLVPAPDVSELLATVARWSGRWTRARRPRHAAVARDMVLLAASLAATRQQAVRALGPVGRGLSLFVHAAAVGLGLVVGALGAATRWFVSFVLAFVALVGSAGNALWYSPAGAPVRAMGGVVAIGLSWAGATVRVIWLPTAALVGIPLAAAARVSAPGRRWLARSMAGLVVAAVVRRALAGARALTGATIGRRGALGPVLAGVVSVLLIGGVVSALTLDGPVASGTSDPRSATSSIGDGGNGGLNASAMSRMLGSRPRGSLKASVDLPPASAPPTPAPPSLADAPPLQPHEIFGFAPYWTLNQSANFDVSGMTTLAYFSVGVNPDGSLDESDSGWAGYQSQALATLVTRAHAAGDRVVLTVTCFSQSALNQLTSSVSAPNTLATALIAAVEAKNLDGVNIDFEGAGSADQVGLTNLVTSVSAALKSANPHFQVTMDTYASSAGDSAGFYNIAALAPAVDGFFVMAYQLNLQSKPSSNSPLTSGMFSDLTTLKQYTAVVPGAKVILGVPYYGYDWPTSNGTLTAQATGGASAIAYSQIVVAGRPTYWDPVTQTAWTSYQVGTQWHEEFFEDPSSLYLEAELAQSFHAAGLGIWALGFDGNDPKMLGALLGFAPAAKNGLAGPTTTPPSPAPSGTTTTTLATTSTSTSTATSTSPSEPSSPVPTTPAPTTSTSAPPATTTTTGTSGGAPTLRYSGTWQGQQVQLTKVPPEQTPLADLVYLGELTGFQTNDPTLSCLDGESGLSVYELSTAATQYEVIADQPTDCATATFTFPWPLPANTGANAGTG